EKLSNLRFDRLGQQRTRATAQDLCEGIGKGPWLGELDDVTVRHGVSLLHWTLGRVADHHATPPYPVRSEERHEVKVREARWAHEGVLALLGLEIGVRCENLSNLRFDRLGQQRTRATAQDLCEEIGKGPWLGELDDVTVRHGVSLLHWRSGGVEHHHDTPPYPVTPSPTSGHSSGRSDEHHWLPGKPADLCRAGDRR